MAVSRVASLFLLCLAAAARRPWLLHLARTAVEKNIFVGMGGIRNHPGLLAVGAGYIGAFGNNGDDVLTGVTGPLGSAGRGVGSN